jgi:hypothetical protein
MMTIYRVPEGNPRLQYYNNTLDYYTLNKRHLLDVLLFPTYVLLFPLASPLCGIVALPTPLSSPLWMEGFILIPCGRTQRA